MAIEVDYDFSLSVDAERQAKVIALGQTVGIWDARFPSRKDFLHSHLSKVVSVRTKLGSSIATLRFPQASKLFCVTGMRITVTFSMCAIT